jgi:hypothetical protein
MIKHRNVNVELLAATARLFAASIVGRQITTTSISVVMSIFDA